MMNSPRAAATGRPLDLPKTPFFPSDEVRHLSPLERAVRARPRLARPRVTADTPVWFLAVVAVARRHRRLAATMTAGPRPTDERGCREMECEWTKCFASQP